MVSRSSRRPRVPGGAEFVVLLLATAAVAVAMSSSMFNNWLPPTWVDLSTVSREMLLIVGPLVAAVGAFVGGAHRNLPLAGPLGRPAHQILLARLGGTTAAIAGGYALGLAPAYMYTFLRSVGGSPNYLVPITSLVQVAALATLGYLAGCVFPTRLMPPVAGIVAFLWMVAVPIATVMSAGDSEYGRSYLSVGFVWADFRADYGYRESAGSGVARLVLFSLLLGAAVMATVEYVERRRDGNWSARLGSYFLVPIVASVVLVASRPGLIEETSEVDCQSVAESSVCVPSEVSTLLPHLAAVADEYGTRFGYGAIDRAARQRPLSETVSLPLSADSLSAAVDRAKLDVALAISGKRACILDPARQTISEQEAVSDALALVLATRVGVGDAMSSGYVIFEDEDAIRYFESMADSELRRFLRTNASKLSECAVALE